MVNIIFFIVCIITGLNAYGREISRVVAAVNNQVVTSKDMQDYCQSMAYKIDDQDKQISCDDPSVREEVLRRLIDDKLILAEAKKGQMEVPRAMIEERLNRVILSYPSREAFETSLVEKGLTITALREILREKILMQSIVEFNVKSFVNISPQEITDFYEKNKETFIAPQTYTFFIAESANYDELKEIGDVISAEGVTKAYRKFGALLFPVESTLQELKPEIGDILGRLENAAYAIELIGDHYYLVFKDNVHESRFLDLEEVRGRIQQYLADLKFKQRFSEWLQQIRETAVIKYYDKN